MAWLSEVQSAFFAGRWLNGGLAVRGVFGDERIDRVGAVAGELVRAGDSVELHIADAVAAADDCLRCGRVGESEARCEVERVDLNQGRGGGRARLRGDQRARQRGLDRIEVGQAIVRLDRRRDDLVAQAKVEGQVGKGAPVVLCIGEVRGLVVADGIEVGKLVAGARAEDEVGKDPGVLVGRVSDSGCVGVGFCGALGESGLVVVGAELRVKVGDKRREPEELVAEFERVLAAQQRVVDLGIDQIRRDVGAGRGRPAEADRPNCA